MISNRFIELLVKKEAGELTLPELKELNGLLRTNLSERAMAELVDEVFEHKLDFDVDAASAENQLSASVQRLQKRISHLNEMHEPVKRIKWRRVIAIAASLLLILASATFYYIYLSRLSPANPNVVFAKRGSKSRIALVDGTKVWLNAESRITYCENFGPKKRELFLEGEAYFDVVKDTAHPFIIHTKYMDVKVVGTAFNVRAYENEKQTDATLIRGIIEVNLKKYPGKKVVLTPFEKISVKTNPDIVPQNMQADNDLHTVYTVTKIKPLKQDTIPVETQWVKNKVVFERQRLDAIAIELSRWFDVEIIITSEELKSKEYSGAIGDANLKDVMEALKLSGRFKYTLDNNIVTISP